MKCATLRVDGVVADSLLVNVLHWSLLLEEHVHSRPAYYTKLSGWL